MTRFALLLLVTLAALASSPATWELSQYADFVKGKLRNISVTRDGSLIPGPAITTVLPMTEASLWTIASAPDGTVYAGTGPKGRIYRWAPKAQSLQLFATLPEPQVFALAVSPTGVLYAAGSPGGTIYEVTQNTAKPYARTGAKFIWALLATKDAVFAASGGDGKIYRATPSASEVYYETGQSNITSLALAADGTLLAGSDPNGILYRIIGKNSAQLLYDAPFTEIRAIVPGKAGEVYFLAMGGAASKRSQNATQPANAPGAAGLPQVTTTITVTEDAQAGIDLKPKPPATQAPTQAAATPVVTSSLDVPGLDRSAIFRLNADLTVDMLYVTKEESIYDLAEHNGKLYFASDSHGRLYRLDADRAASLLVETGESEIGRILHTAAGWLAAATTTPKLISISEVAAPPYEYESPVHEAANIARWGALNATANPSPAFETRSGNTTKPDATWSSWAPLVGANIQSPTARFIQWRIRTTQDFIVHSVALNYLPRNQPPLIKSITAVLAMVPTNAPKPQAATATSATYTLTVTDTGEASSSTSAGTASLLATRPAGRQLMISWVAEDPDTDTLQYSLHFRAEDELAWKPLKHELTETNFSIDADTLADGRYLFRVIASDTLSNPGGSARTAEFTSVPVQLDQTAPTIDASLVNGRLSVKCADTASPIRRIEYSINAGRWILMEASDGIYDSREESASATLILPVGESLITIRAFDAALNVSLRKLVIRP